MGLLAPLFFIKRAVCSLSRFTLQSFMSKAGRKGFPLQSGLESKLCAFEQNVFFLESVAS